MKLKPTFFDFDECEIGFRVPREIMEANRWGNAINGCEVDLEPMTKNAALGIKELAATDSQHTQLAIAARAVIDAYDSAHTFDDISECVDRLRSALQQQAGA